MAMDLHTYSVKHRHFLASELPPLLAQVARPGLIVDLGCGDGAVIWALERAGLLGHATIAVDMSPERVAHAVSVIPGVRGIVSDATHVHELEDESVDGVVASQLIEHVPDDASLIAEVARILRPGGWWYVGTVLRGPNAWWIYKVDGVRRLDPTHVREYESVSEFKSVLEHPRLSVDEVRARPMRFPISDLVLRAASRAGLSAATESLYRDRPWMERARRLKLRVPDYFLLEASGTKVID